MKVPGGEIVILKDEHKQPICVYEYMDNWYWVFENWPDDEEQEPSNGFATREEAIQDAQNFVDQAAI